MSEREVPLGTAAPSPALATLPFEAAGSLMYVAVRVEGSDPLSFIIDSGANVCVIGRGPADRLGLKLDDASEGRGAGAGTYPVRWIRRPVRFTLYEVPFDCDPVAVIDTADNVTITGRDLDGVLGFPFFNRFVVETDYTAQTLRLFEPDSFSYAGNGDTLPLTFERSLPYVRGRVRAAGREFVEASLLVDSGSEDAVDDSAILDGKEPPREVTAGVGQGQEHRAYFGTLEAFQLGRFQFGQVPSVAPGVKLIGGEVLRRFTVVYDFRRSCIHLEPNQHYSDAFQSYLAPSGASLRQARDRVNLRVHEVMAEGPAEAAGVLPDDVITHVDGVAIAQLGLRRTQELFARRSRAYRLSIVRGDRQLDVSLRIP